MVPKLPVSRTLDTMTCQTCETCRLCLNNGCIWSRCINIAVFARASTNFMSYYTEDWSQTTQVVNCVSLIFVFTFIANRCQINVNGAFCKNTTKMLNNTIKCNGEMFKQSTQTRVWHQPTIRMRSWYGASWENKKKYWLLLFANHSLQGCVSFRFAFVKS